MSAVRIPRDNVNDDEVLLLGWRVPSGSLVNEGEVLVELQTSKASFDMTAPRAGYVRYSAKEREVLKVGQVLCHITPTLSEQIEVISETTSLSHESTSGNSSMNKGSRDSFLSEFSRSPAPSSVKSKRTRFSPMARVLMERYGVSGDKFIGFSLVRSQDVLCAAGLVTSFSEEKREENSEKNVAQRNKASDADRSSEIQEGTQEGIEISWDKRSEIKQLRAASESTLPSTIAVQCDTCGVRELLKRDATQEISLLALVVYEAARLLKKYPRLNGAYRQGRVIHYPEINIGVAFDAGSGLKVPIIHGADTKSIQVIYRQLEEYSLDYLQGTLSPQSLTGGTFTITDLSSFGATHFVPLLSSRQSAILGIGAEFSLGSEAHKAFNIILTFDHQVSEGREVSEFLSSLRAHIKAYEDALTLKQEEPCCERCLRTLSAIKEERGSLLQEVVGRGEVSFVCSFCLEGW